MSENGYTGVGFSPYPPSVPQKPINYNVAERKFPSEGLVNHPVHHGSPSFKSTDPQQFNTSYANNKTLPSISPGIIKVYAATPPIYSNPNNAKDKVRIMSHPIGADMLKFEREKELQREMERERMGIDWEVARKRGTGESEDGDRLARWK